MSERSKVLDSKSSVARATGGSNPPLSAIYPLHAADFRGRSLANSKEPQGFPKTYGEVTERPKVHDWKSCVSQGTGGSNPPFSAISVYSYLKDQRFLVPSDAKFVNPARPGREQR